MYSKSEIISEIDEKYKDICNFYKSKIINYNGKSSDSKEEYSQIIAEELLNLDIKNVMSTIDEVIREKGYRIKSHNGKVITNISAQNSNRKEERFAIDLFNYSKKGTSFNRLGKIIDYQIPLKNSNKDKGVGKIDLISTIDDDIFLIELKINGNKETLLRCILEIATYYQILSKSKFIESYKGEIINISEKNIKKAILIVNGSSQHDTLKSINNGEKNSLKKLMEVLEIHVFVIDEKSLIVK